MLSLSLSLDSTAATYLGQPKKDARVAHVVVRGASARKGSAESGIDSRDRLGAAVRLGRAGAK